MKTHNLALVLAALAAVPSCAPLPDPEFVYGEQLGALQFVVRSPDQGVYPDASIVEHPDNPFRWGVSLENKFAAQDVGPIPAFYAWATALVQEPTGEHQYFAAAAARDIYVARLCDDEDLVYARDIAVRGFQQVLITFPDSAATFDVTGTLRFPLLVQAIDGIVGLGGRVPPGWSVVVSADGTRTAVFVGS
jgi:hypothetical protein